MSSCTVGVFKNADLMGVWNFLSFFIYPQQGAFGAD